MKFNQFYTDFSSQDQLDPFFIQLAHHDDHADVPHLAVCATESKN